MTKVLLRLLAAMVLLVAAASPASASDEIAPPYTDSNVWERGEWGSFATGTYDFDHELDRETGYLRVEATSRVEILPIRPFITCGPETCEGPGHALADTDAWFRDFTAVDEAGPYAVTATLNGFQASASAQNTVAGLGIPLDGIPQRSAVSSGQVGLAVAWYPCSLDGHCHPTKGWSEQIEVFRCRNGSPCLATSVDELSLEIDAPAQGKLSLYVSASIHTVMAGEGTASAAIAFTAASLRMERI